VKKKTTTEFIIDARKKHGNKYDYSLVEYINRKTDIKIICPIHGVFEQKPYIHLDTFGCPKCGKERISESRRTSIETFIDKSNAIHNNKYDYSLTKFKTLNDKVKIICPIHGVFEQRAYSHYFHGCPKCNGGIATEQSEFIKRVSDIHNNHYNYSLIDYKNAHDKIKIVCPIHGVFEQRPFAHLQNQQGCPFCANEQRKMDSKDFIDKCNNVHNNKYDYSLVEYTIAHDKVKIICPIHGIFEQRAYSHLQGQGCPLCPITVSSDEIEIKEWLSSFIDIETNSRSIISPYELDIVIPSKKIAIEYNGLFWHSEQHVKRKDYHLNKTRLCEEEGYRLIHIFEDEWRFKQNIVKSRLKHILNFHDRTLYARKCFVRDITTEQARQFVEEYHIQGYTNCQVKLGLFSDTELIAVMTFAKPSISKGNKNKEGVYELSRFCCSTKVIGGAGKLLKYFIRNYKPVEIFTYADLRWSQGQLYESIGFDFVSYTPMNYYYIINKERKHRFGYRKSVLPIRLGNFDPNLTEYQNMLNNGYDRVWDCGNIKYEMKL